MEELWRVGQQALSAQPFSVPIGASRGGVGYDRLRREPGGSAVRVGRLPDFALDAAQPFGGRFASLGIRHYRGAARLVYLLPYGRNSDRSDWRLVLDEGRGTCSTKHALLSELARENGRRVALVLGIYEMDEANTPGVGAVLKPHGLRSIPEAHCYLDFEGARVDLTRQDGRQERIQRLLHEEEIEPYQIGEYKVEAHKRFVRRWGEERGLDPVHLWRVREECIAALADRSQFECRPSER